VKIDHFAVRADGYDTTDYRLRYVEEMARSILDAVSLTKETVLLDFGAGTGLLTERIAPYVGKIIAVDISPSMIEQLEQKRETLPCELETLRVDLCREAFAAEKVDGIVSTMTLHHIEDVPALFRRFRQAMKPGAFLALCDIDSEDGTFHTLDTGVKHFGFDRKEIIQWCKEAGFVDIHCVDSTVIVKPHGEYSAFFLSGRAPDEKLR